MVGHGGSSAGLYLANPTSPIPSHCASTVATSTVRVTKLPLTKPCLVTDGWVVTAGISVTWSVLSWPPDDLEVMSSNPARVELGVRSTSVPSRTWTKKYSTHLLYLVKTYVLYFPPKCTVTATILTLSSSMECSKHQGLPGCASGWFLGRHISNCPRNSTKKQAKYGCRFIGKQV